MFHFKFKVNECYSSGENAVSIGCAGFDGPESSARVTGRGDVQDERGSVLHHPAVVDVLKRWQTTSDDSFCCPDYALEFGSFVQGGETKTDG